MLRAYGIIISKEDYAKIRNEEDIQVIGFTCKEKYDEKKHQDYEELRMQDGKSWVVRKDMSGKTIGYVDCGSGNYVAIKQKRYSWILLLIILIILALWLLTRCSDDNTIVLENGVEINLDKQPTLGEQAAIAIPGLGIEYILTENNKVLNLINPENNTVYFKYTVKEGDTVIHTTDWITPNKMVQLDLWSLLDAGQHDIVVHLDTLDVITEEACTSVDLDTIITVKK